MKKLFLVSALSFFSISAFAQDDAANKLVVDQFRKDKEKSDKDVSDPKSSAKASFWMERAKLYENIALQGSEVDSSAAKTSLEAYKKVVELDKTKKGEPGKSAKEAENVLAGGEGSQLFNAFVKQGAEKYQAKNLAGALEMFTAAQEINKKDTLASLYGGIAAQQLDKKDVAKEQFEKYAANGGKDPSVFYGLAQLYREEKNFDKAIEALNKGLAQAPNNKDLKAEVVNILLASGNESKAISELEALAQADPKNIQNVVNLAILYDNMQRTAADSVKQMSAKMGSGSKSAASLTKNLEAEKGKIEVFDGEVKRIGALIKKQPKNADLKRQLADVNTKKKETLATIATMEGEVKAATEAAASSASSGSEQKLNELKAKQKAASDKAIANYKKALEIDGTNYDALYNLGVYYFNEAVQLKGEVDNMNMTEYQQRGKEVEGRVCGKFKKAKPYFEKAIQAKDEAEAKENLTTVNGVLEQFAGKGVACVEE
ncbi:tetratricopeptide repeat protein [Dyadobacter chenwenxiniae]|uniref:Tetratricopeptide repeat protein n=1 Tax=Dyadobacter chenwenxiniae TaxID=2906456 RepID=A0A9X1TM45_9BACT|nr:tetratricopeptide repeat protein [Dyadobacter chenwenxiniae]MCF0063073.1 tetratricopeptide repeat protein [Dyadobacter chenwenxiniae]UON84755.1 tetratricopeptide repeat protein [Dyadobacter chenwenxiniae]